MNLFAPKFEFPLELSESSSLPSTLARSDSASLETMPGLKFARGSPTKRASPSKADKGKGKQVDTSSAATGDHSASPAAAAAQDRTATMNADANGEGADENELLRLAERIAQNAHLLVRGRGDSNLAEHARQVVKHSFDQGTLSAALLSSRPPD